jgi:S1-C subfamily serine protease
LTTGDPAKLTSGQPIVAVGNAGGLGGTPSVVTGTVAALDQSVTASDLGGGNPEQLSDMIEINASLQPGDSGGPLVNASSQVVGMDTAASTSGRSLTSVGFSIPISRAISIAQQIIAGHASSNIQIGLPGFLGVSVSPTNPTTVAGAAVSGILPGTPADKAGLTAGDVITSLNGQPVKSATGLTSLLQQTHAGDKVTVGWLDSTDVSHTATVTLVTGPAA